MKEVELKIPLWQKFRARKLNAILKAEGIDTSTWIFHEDWIDGVKDLDHSKIDILFHYYYPGLIIIDSLGGKQEIFVKYEMLKKKLCGIGPL